MGSIGERLKLWRGYMGLTQAEFAELSKINEAQIKKYEIDISIPGGKIMQKIAATGVNSHWLLTGEGEMINKEHPKVLIYEPSPTISISADLEELTPQIESIFKILEEMDKEKREDFLSQMYKSVKEIQRIDNMEKLLEELSKKRKTGS